MVNRGRSDLPLERLVRQMVLAPRQDLTPPKKHAQINSGINNASAPSHIDEPGANAPARLDQPLRPTAVSTSPELVSFSPAVDRREPAPAKPSSLPSSNGPEQSLSPVPQPIHLHEPASSETVVQIKIGRIDVRTSPETPASAPARTHRPVAAMMSLDDYLLRRSQEG